ncbi:MAG: hypothetical protein R3326_04125 [Gemmatimonadota bacterium]|nr:hypothetical protein [Gemmatimonadota bacterium]
MRWRAWMPLVLGLVVATAVGCDRAGRDGDDRTTDEEVQVDEDLGTLKVANRVNEPIAIHLDGQEIFVVQPGQSYTFRNLPTGTVNVYGVGRISQKHFGLPRLTIEEGGDYEWTIEP